MLLIVSENARNSRALADLVREMSLSDPSFAVKILDYILFIRYQGKGYIVLL